MKHNLTGITHKNKFYKRFLIFALLGLLPNIAFADTVTYDYNYNGLSLRYELDINTKTANCVGLSPGVTASGDLVIPDFVEYNEERYPVIEISRNAFEDCSGFTGSLTIGNSVTKIGWMAFYECSGFTGSLTIPDSVTEIGEWSFSSCSGFRGSLTFGNSVTKIGESAFNRCSGFTGSLRIPNSVTDIGGHAFFGCSGFTGSLRIPDSVTEIGNGAFSGCYGFTGSLTIPDSVTEIGDNAFFECFRFTGSLTIPDSVTKIGESAFYGCSGFTGSLIIGNSVATIGVFAFRGCSGLNGSLIIGNSVATIGESAFNSTKFDKIVSYNDNPPNCISSCFNNYNIPLYVPDNSIELYHAAEVWKNFNNIKPIEDLENPVDGLDFEYGGILYTIISAAAKTVKTRVNGYQQGHQNLTGSLFIPSKVEYNGAPYTVIEIGDYSFYDCKGLNGELELPETLKTIGKFAFYYCSGFNGLLTIPVSVAEIGSYAFANCSGFNGSLTIGNSVTEIGRDAFSYCTGFKGSLTIGNSVKEIGMYAFYECSGFTGSLTIPDSVTEIGEWSFSCCSGFTGSLTIGNSVATIGLSAFEGTYFDKIESYNETPPNCYSSSFHDYNIPLYVPANSIDLYKAAEVWKNFSYIGLLPGSEIEAESITLSVSNLELTIGQTSQLTATVSPENTTDKTVTWKSDNPGVATVETDGTVTAVSVGTANITATCGTATAACKVTVSPVTATGITLNVESLTMTIGQTSKLTATVYPENTTDKTVTWKSDNPGVATVETDGTVTAVSIGTVNITAINGDASASCRVTVNPVTATGVTLNVEAVTMTIGQTSKLTATVLPANTTDKTVTWKSDNQGVATVGSDGTVTAVAQGIARITVTCGNVSATCLVTVNPVVATGITLSMEAMTITIGKTQQLRATITPANTTDKTVAWRSDNPAVATVSANGTVTAISQGTANITATSGKVTAICRITVNPVVSTGVVLNMEAMSLMVGQTNQLTATIIPANTTNPVVTWTSDNQNVATVETDGTVTALSVGTANITATIGTATATCKVTVNPVGATGITLNVEAMTMILGESSKLTAAISPTNTTDPTVIWSSDNESVATVTADGTVTAHSQGLANITATCGAVSATCKVTVDPISATGLTLNVEAMGLILGESSKLTATVLPDNVTDKTVTWSSDNPAVATVGADGTVTAVGKGSANIIASNGNVTAICRVTVGLPQVIGINLSPLTMTLSSGETSKINAAFVPAASETNLTWTSNEPSIVEVSEDGTVVAVGAGTAVIYATSANGVTGVATVKVSDNSAETVSITPQDLILTIGETTQLKAEITPQGAAAQITWSSRDASIVDVNSEGLITAKGTGATVIYASTENGVTGVATVTVIDGNELLSITVSPEILNLSVGGETQLNVITQPATASQEIRWLSSDTSVAEVSDSGVVNAISPGVAVIYAMTENGLTGFSSVNVVENIVTSITIEPDDLFIELDETAQLKATLLPLGVEAALTWTSTDMTVATVDNLGVVTAREPGYTFIYATSPNGVTGLSMVRVNDPTTGDFDPGHGYGENGVYISAVRIREGDPLGLFAERPLNFENNDWTYEWYLNGQLEAEGKYAVVTAGEPSGWPGTRKSTFSEQYQVEIYNTIGDEILQDLPQVTVYNRPITPMELIKKGDGETSSFIALSNLPDTELANLGYSFVFGYTDGEGVNHIISNSTLRYCHTSKNIYDNPQYRFWVYTTWTFSDGATITSGLRYLDGTVDENFDRSDFNFSRSGSIEGLEGDVETRIYSLSGNMVGKETDRLSPGIYIIVERQGKQISTRKIIKR